MKKRLWAVILALLLLALAGCRAAQTPPAQGQAPTFQAAQPSDPAELDEAEATEADPDPQGNTESLDEAGSYDSRDDVALYLRLYGELPGNYITKDEAEDLGWSGGSVERVAPGKCIGGDAFGNREGLLPKANGRTWTECDIDTLGEDSRGAKRIVYSNDGLIYYTDDHYESFERLYPEP